MISFYEQSLSLLAFYGQHYSLALPRECNKKSTSPAEEEKKCEAAVEAADTTLRGLVASDNKTIDGQPCVT